MPNPVYLAKRATVLVACRTFLSRFMLFDRLSGPDAGQDTAGPQLLLLPQLLLDAAASKGGGMRCGVGKCADELVRVDGSRSDIRADNGRCSAPALSARSASSPTPRRSRCRPRAKLWL